MRISDFESMVRRMANEVPPEFLEGIAEVVVSPRTVPHPAREEVFTLGECIPLPAGMGAEVESVQSRVVLYHGSFAALARLTTGFDWRHEAWETLTHELRHHLEWRARAPDLEELDWAVEQNFARHEGEPFDPAFYLQGEPIGQGLWKVEDDVFIDRVVGAPDAELETTWGDRSYRVKLPAETTLPAFLTLEGLDDPPDGDVVLVLRRRPGLLSLLRRSRLFQRAVKAEPSGYLAS